MHRHPKDVAYLKKLRTEGVLRGVANAALPSQGVICISCADGHQVEDIVRHLHDGRFPLWTRLWYLFLRFIGLRQPVCSHTIALNGGALLLPRESPLNHGEGDMICRHIAAGMEIKGLQTVTPLAHYPCGAAAAVKMDLPEVLRQLQAAARELRERFPNTRVIPLLHIDWGPRFRWGRERKRTYLLVDEGSPMAVRLSLPSSRPTGIIAKTNNTTDNAA